MAFRTAARRTEVSNGTVDAGFRTRFRLVTVLVRPRAAHSCRIASTAYVSGTIELAPPIGFATPAKMR